MHEDSLDSMVNEDEAMKLVQQLKQLRRRSWDASKKVAVQFKEDFEKNRYEGQSKAN